MTKHSSILLNPDRIFVGGTAGEHSLAIALELERCNVQRLVYHHCIWRLGAWVALDYTDRVQFMWCGWASGKTARTVAKLLKMELHKY